MKHSCLAVFSKCYDINFWGKFIPSGMFLIIIVVIRNANNMTFKVKSEYFL